MVLAPSWSSRRGAEGVSQKAPHLRQIVVQGDLAESPFLGQESPVIVQQPIGWTLSPRGLLVRNHPQAAEVMEQLG